MAGFSDVYCHACNPFGGPLPVTLLSFTGQHQDGANLLQWVTATENGVSHFELERATEEGVFENITKQMAAGNSTTLRHYAYRDRDFSAGGLFYRLRTVDVDGSEALSQVVYLNQETDQPWAWSVFPNPADEQATVSLSLPQEAVILLRVVDAMGRVQQQVQVLGEAGLLQIPLNTSGLPDGLYQLWLSVEGGAPAALPLMIAQP
jgi:hypothetical protein